MGDDHLRRTAVTHLDPTPADAERLERTFDEWREAANLAVDIGYRTEVTAKTTLQSLAYDDIRSRLSLGSQQTILATHHAARVLKGMQERRNRGRKSSKPRFTAPTIPYDSRCMTLFEEEEEVSLTTVDGRVRCDLRLPDAEDGYQWEYLEDWDLMQSKLTVRDGEYFLHIGFKKESPVDEGETADDRTVLGVDLGIENVAVTSTAHFEPGGRLHHRREKFLDVRGGLQQTGTRSAHLTLQNRGDRESRYACDFLHGVSKRLVSEAEEYDCDTIAFENLTYIRDSMPSEAKFHQWAHRRLVEFTTYKAAELGIEVEFVDPSQTSRTCSDCGYMSERNRPSRNRFECKECGSQANADYNAAKNIGMRYVRRGPQSSRRTGDRQLALKSGTVTPNRGFSTYPSGSEVEDTDKSTP